MHQENLKYNSVLLKCSRKLHLRSLNVSYKTEADPLGIWSPRAQASLLLQTVTHAGAEATK